MKVWVWGLTLLIGIIGMVTGVQSGDGAMVVGSFFFIAIALVLTQ